MDQLLSPALLDPFWPTRPLANYQNLPLCQFPGRLTPKKTRVPRAARAAHAPRLLPSRTPRPEDEARNIRLLVRHALAALQEIEAQRVLREAWRQLASRPGTACTLRRCNAIVILAKAKGCVVSTHLPKGPANKRLTFWDLYQNRPTRENQKVRSGRFALNH